MTDKTKKTLRVGYFALITIALVTVAVLLMVACVAIYRTGPFPFTRELVAHHFDRIAVPVYICLGLVALGFVLSPLLPTPTDTDKDRERMMVHRLRQRHNLSLCPTELADAIRREGSRRRLHRLVTIGLFAAGMSLLLWHTLSFQRFSMEDINGSFVNFGWLLALCVGIPGLYGVVSLYVNRQSYRREIELFRQVPREAKIDAPIAKKAAWETVVKLAVLVTAIGMIVGGWLADGWVDVLTKAINICTECVGLG